jgi:hypothetical protein
MPLPDLLEDDVHRWKEYAFGNDMGTPPMRLAEWTFAGRDTAAHVKALLDVRQALGNDPAGRAHFVQVLEAGQQITLRQADPAINDNAHATFQKAVTDGAIGPDDGKALVDGQVQRFSGDNAPATPDQPKVGEAHVGLGRSFGELSSYIDTLGHDTRSNFVRTAFLHEAIDQALALRAKAPAVAAQLYAEAANAMADLPPAEVKAELADIARKDGPQGVARFAAGAASGEADRAKPVDVPVGRYEFRADGLGVVMQKINALVEQGQQSRKFDRAAETMGGQLFTGTTGFLSEARGSEQDHLLADYDARTGLRQAMNATMRTNFDAVFRQNAMQDGEGLRYPGAGFDTITSYARFQFGAKGDAYGRATASEAAEVLGQKLGSLEADLLKAARDGGADLRRDFGAGTFGDRAHEQANAALTMGQLIGAVRNGINQDFDVRADRSKSNQAEMQGSYEFEAKVMSYAGKVAGEEAKPFFEGAEKIFEALKTATPQTVTAESGRGEQFKMMERDFADALAKYRPNLNLVKQLEDGRSHANSEWAEYKNDREHAQTNAAELGSQKGLLSQLMTKHLVPQPDDPAKPLPHEELPKNEVERRTTEAVDKYNAAHHDKLPKPSDIGEWNGAAQKGVVLQIGPEDYVISAGRGNYRHFDTEQTHGVHPVPDRLADLNPDGTIHQNVRGTEALTR